MHIGKVFRVIGSLLTHRSPVDSPDKASVMRSLLSLLSSVSPKTGLNKQPNCSWFDNPGRQCDVTIDQQIIPHIDGLVQDYSISISHWRTCSLFMMTSSNGSIFRVTGHLCGEFTGPRWIRRTKASDAELSIHVIIGLVCLSVVSLWSTFTHMLHVGVISLVVNKPLRFAKICLCQINPPELIIYKHCLYFIWCSVAVMRRYRRDFHPLWAFKCPKLPVTRMFVRQLQTNNDENIKAHSAGFVRGTQRWQNDSPHKELVMRGVVSMWWRHHDGGIFYRCCVRTAEERCLLWYAHTDL